MTEQLRKAARDPHGSMNLPPVTMLNVTINKAKEILSRDIILFVPRNIVSLALPLAVIRPRVGRTMNRRSPC